MSQNQIQSNAARDAGQNETAALYREYENARRNAESIQREFDQIQDALHLARQAEREASFAWQNALEDPRSDTASLRGMMRHRMGDNEHDDKTADLPETVQD